MRKMIETSIFKKLIVASAGFLLILFAIFHLAGNMLMLVSAQAFNQYSAGLIANPFIYPIEIALLLVILTHVILALRLQLENRRARPERYKVRKRTGHGSTLASSTMSYTGTILLTYLIFHIWQLKFGPIYMVTYNGVEIRDLQRLVLEYFSNPVNVVLYVIAMSAFGVHLSHGFWSVFQSVGFNHVKYTPILKLCAVGFGSIMSIGFSILPIWAYVQGSA